VRPKRPLTLESDTHNSEPRGGRKKIEKLAVGKTWDVKTVSSAKNNQKAFVFSQKRRAVRGDGLWETAGLGETM